MAPPGLSRADLAEALARLRGGSVRRSFSFQSEPSKVPDKPVFESLTLAFDVLDRDGDLLVRLVDDLTLQNDLDRMRPARPGWYRIVSDDRRWLRLIVRSCDAKEPIDTVLQPVADLFASRLSPSDDGMFRLEDDEGLPIAIAAPLPGERERPCEIVTASMLRDHAEALESVLAPARDMGFRVPNEAAVHLHFDAGALCDTRVFARLVRLLEVHGEGLRRIVATNPNCRRLGRQPDALYDLIASPEFIELPWEDARLQILKIGLIKYCDFNFLNIIAEPRGKHTFEVRILPGSLDAQEIIQWAGLFESILKMVTQFDEKDEELTDLCTFITMLPLSIAARDKWMNLARMA